MDRGKSNPRRRSSCFARKTKLNDFSSRHEMGLQQLWLRAARIHRRQDFREIVRRISTRANLRTAENGANSRVRKRQKRGRQARFRSLERSKRLEADRPEFHLRDFRRRRRVLLAKRSRQVGPCADATYPARRKRNAPGFHCGATCRRRATRVACRFRSSRGKPGVVWLRVVP